MMRMVGAALLVLGCGAVGMGAVFRMSGRIRDLGALILGLDAAKRELLSSMDRLGPVMGVAAQSTEGRARNFFLACRNGLEEPKPAGFCEVWKTALETAPLRLEACDRTELIGLGTVLGCYDAEHQAAALERTIRRLEVRLAEAKEQKRSRGNVYGTLGVSAGAVLAILLI